MTVLEEGQKSPDFTLPTDGGGEFKLSSFYGKRVVVYFYPKDNTPGCTKQACALRDAEPDLSALGVPVVGISKDSASKHDKFKAKHDLNFLLASDRF